MVLEIKLKPIGIVHVPYTDEEVKSSLKGVDGIVEVYPKYKDGLRGIDGFSHIILIAYLHKLHENDKSILSVRFRRFLRFGFKPEELPEVGVFACDSPVRPNPIALTIVELVKREDRMLYVKGLDLFDKTPILDIKPYTPSRIVKDLKLPKWYMEFLEKVEKRLGINEL